jgi:hypothetical protein
MLHPWHRPAGFRLVRPTTRRIVLTSAAVRPSSSSSSSTTTTKALSRRQQRRSQTRPLPLTLRERIIVAPHTLHREYKEKNKSLAERGGELLDVAESRINWLRSKVFSVWNSSYGESTATADGVAAAASTSNNAGAAAATTTPSANTVVLQERIKNFRQYEVVMDFRWWVWNLAFAVMPAVVIFLYCELYGKHAMYAYHQKVELAQMKRAMGEEWCDKYAAQILQVQKERDHTDWSDRLARLVREWSALTWHQLRDGLAGAMGVGGFGATPPPTLYDGSTGTTGGLPSDPPRASIDTATAPREDQQQRPDNAVVITEPPLELTGDKTIDALIRKVQLLEAKVLEQQQPQQLETTTSEGTTAAAGAWTVDDRIRRVQQSGIGNRVEDAAVAKWEKILADKGNRARPDDSSGTMAFLSRQWTLLVDRFDKVVSSGKDDGMVASEEQTTAPALAPTSSNNNTPRADGAAQTLQSHQQQPASSASSSSNNNKTANADRGDTLPRDGNIDDSSTAAQIEQQRRPGLLGWLQKQWRPTDDDR